ncbi:MAG: squalene synthase HpnC [Solirubrobacterales bacterium]|nr:squalene synthase HpnC [Solirubrobacterales bacterium]
MTASAPSTASTGGRKGSASAAEPPEVMAQASSENFPVASRLLPRTARGDLLAVYGFARLVDDAGDEASGDRLALLDELEGDLEAAFVRGGAPSHPLISALRPTIARRSLPIEPFRALIEANRRDQLVHRYQTFAELLGYCELSANPVGELVLGILDAATPRRLELSNRICSALQLVEHWQDVAEDHRRGRVYLPAEDLERFGVLDQELADHAATESFKRLMAFEVARARGMLSEGAPLVRTLRGRSAFAVAAFVAGGRAALLAVERADFDVLASRPRPGAALRAQQLLATLLRPESR